MRISYAKGSFVILSMALALYVNASDAKQERTPKQKGISLGQLYAKYADEDYSSMSMPELNQEFAITGIVLGHSRSAVGHSSILFAGDDAASDEELARLGARDEHESKKMDALKVGDRFAAVCVLDMTSGSRFMSLSDCVFK